MQRSLTPRLALLLTLAPLLWAGNAVVGRLAVGQVPPLTLNFLRWLLALLLLLPLGWRVLRQPRQIRERWAYLLAIGLLGVGSYNALQYLALVTSTPINVTLIAASSPVWMALVGVLFFGEPPTLRQGAGAFFSLAGVVLVLARGELASLAEVRFVRGDLYVVLAVISWAFYSWLLARPPASMRAPHRPDWDWAGMLLLQTAFGLTGAGLACGLERGLTGATVHWSVGVLALLAYVAIGASIVAYRCWGLGVAEGGPTLAAFFANLTPLFAAVLSAALLGEVPHAYHALAFALIVAGIVVTALPRSRPR